MGFDVDLLGAGRARAIRWFDTIDSTMHEAVRLASEGAPSGTAVVAGEQTAGQGRHGRRWDSQPGTGLYVSIVLRVSGVALSELPVVTLALGLAAAHAIRLASAVNCDLRWPNDVLIGDKKCCGILTQLHGMAIVAGIGVNINQTAFPGEIEKVATSLRLASGAEIPRELVLRHLLDSIDTHIEILRNQGKQAILRLFEQASSYVRGRRVIVDESLQGTTHGLTPDGFLLLLRDDGVESVIYAGGVRPL
jgi:BirA family transcriptional regulator, biotin operon repressor / biotin---[acetyl-CoA-carboxylase] ligase